MRKLLILLIFVFFYNSLISQEIYANYKYNKTEKNGYFIYFESENLILYKDGTFTKSYFYKYHEINSEELNGNWKIENDKLLLIATAEKQFGDENWTEINEPFSYNLKRKKIVPENNNKNLFVQKKLHLNK